MTSRVLIADDSLTIQKVIGITLASSGYELVECLSEEDLFRKIQSNHFDLILLDFNLSDSRSGYDLAKQINQAVPAAAIIVMLGTFDTIEESQFSSCGISDKIVKPFESSKFIKKCRDLLEGARPAFTEEIKPATTRDSLGASFDGGDDTSGLDMWKVDAPLMNSKEDVELETSFETHTPSLDPLASEIEGWGFTPNNHLEEKFQKAFPPLIEEVPETNILERLQTSSLFVQGEDFSNTDDNETDPAFEIPEDLNRNLLSEIEDEISAEAFWAVDEVVPVKAEEETYILETNLDEVTADLTEAVQTFKNRESSKNPKETDQVIHMDTDELVEKLKISLRPMIEEMVREFCRQNAEKVAWEVIPDLAENLIRKEIKEISESIKH